MKREGCCCDGGGVTLSLSFRKVRGLIIFLFFYVSMEFIYEMVCRLILCIFLSMAVYNRGMCK